VGETPLLEPPRRLPSHFPSRSVGHRVVLSHRRGFIRQPRVQGAASSPRIRGAPALWLVQLRTPRPPATQLLHITRPIRSLRPVAREEPHAEIGGSHWRDGSAAAWPVAAKPRPRPQQTPTPEPTAVAWPSQTPSLGSSRTVPSNCHRSCHLGPQNAKRPGTNEPFRYRYRDSKRVRGSVFPGFRPSLLVGRTARHRSKPLRTGAHFRPTFGQDRRLNRRPADAQCSAPIRAERQPRDGRHLREQSWAPRG
jgi:hypothetical protein